MPGFAPVDPKQNFPDLEERTLERWREQDLFARTLAERADAPIWSFYEGPPTANGRPGSHHVLARVFKDIYPRYRTMCGYRVPRKAGWDCHGLPVELEVEKQLGISSKGEIEEFGIAEFNQRCRESVFEYVEEWNRLTERIGFWVDLDDPYVTLEDRYIESVWWSLSQLFEKGRLYEGHKVVPYCPRDGTPLSSHEVAQGYQDVKDASIYVRFPLVGSGREDGEGDEGGERGGDAERESLLVWTTTPWTLPGNKAVAVNPAVAYVRARVETDGEVLIVARELAEKVLGEGAEILEELPGTALLGRSYSGPVFELSDVEPGAYPVIAGDYVTTEDGTGLVHIAPPFGEDDYTVAAAAGIFDPTVASTLYNPVRPDGKFDDRVIGFAGEFVKGRETTRRLIDRLAERGLLFREQVYEHAYPHCWRCGTPLLYYATTSWYIGTSAAREELLANNETIGWHPEHVKHGRFGKWLENNVDWALSRNRYWGTPLPIWRCEDSGCAAVTCIGSTEELRERSGGEVPEDLHRPYIDEVTIRCQDCGKDMRRVSSVIDTWYDSGAMPFAQFHYPFEGQEEFAERFPADYICEAQDQTRGWFYTLLAESTLLFEQSSFKNCVCLGLILDPEGQKMSKSRGNVVDPWEVLAAHGADAFRWYYLTTQQPWAGYRFSLETVGESVRQFMLTLWNTYSFWVLYANATDDLDLGGGELTDLDRWALSRLQATVATVRERMDDFDCTTAGRAIAEFVEGLSNWYVRLSRRRFWDGDPAAFATLRTCLLETGKMLAPFTPFLADEIYRNLQGGAAGEFGEAPDSVHLASFPEVDEALLDPELEAGMAAVQRTVRLGHAARSAGKVKVRQPLRRAVIVASEDERASIEALADLVTAELNVIGLDFVSEEGELVTYTVKPNYRTLGPRFGKHMPQVAAAVAVLDASRVAETLAEGGEVGISIDGTDHTLGPDDLTLALEPLEGYEVEAEAGHAVALQLEIDEELRRAGLAREVVRAVQDARKNAGLEITDRIALGLGGDAELLAVAQEHEAYIAGETLATSITFGNEDGAGSTVSVATIDTRELRIFRPSGLTRAIPSPARRGLPRRLSAPGRAAAARSLALLALLAVLGVALLAPGTAAAAGEGSGGLAGSTERPQLLLIHGGSFLYNDPTFEPLTRGRAIAAGFVPHYVTYPLDNLPAAVERVRAEAQRLRQKFGLDRVYAYGASAGGTLVALLSGQDLVAAGVAKAPVSDLATWEWPTAKYGPEYWNALGVNEAARLRLSPTARPEKAPLLVIQGRADNVVPPSMNETFAARFSRVRLWLVAGGHTTERVRPFLITRAMHWLARIAASKMAAQQEAEAPPEAGE